MSLTLLTYPGDTSSVSNEMLFVVQESTKASDPVNYPNYKFVLDLYVNSVLVARLKSQPHPTTYLGIFDISKQLQPYFTYGLDLSSNKVDYDSRLQYQVKLGEEYADTTYTNLITDSSRYCIKSYKRRAFDNSAVIHNGLASNMPSEINCVGKNASILYQLIPIYSNVTGVSDLTITYKDKNGNTLSTTTVSNSDFIANKIRQFNVVNSDDDVEYATVATSVPVTGAINLRINYQCTKHPTRYIAWLNPFGAYDSHTFGMVSVKSQETERKEYSQVPYQIDASGVITYSANNVFYGQQRTFAAASKTRMRLTSRLLTDDEYTWLADLFASTDVYLYDEDSAKWVPVRITATNYEYRTYLNSRLVPLEFEVEYSDFNSQYL